MATRFEKQTPTSAPTLVLPEDPMHKALAEAQAQMTTEQRLAFIKKLFPPDLSPSTQET